MKRYRSLLLLTLAFFAGSLATGFVFAHGGDISLIHACVKNSNGSIRIVGANDTCTGNETPLDWNIQGIPGPSGPPGPSGAPGASGSGGLVNNLVGADFSTASIPYHNFAGQDLHGSKFENSLPGINVRTNLTGSDFSNANLSGASFLGTIMTKMNASGTNFSGATFRRTSASGEIRVDNANFQNANFYGATFTGFGGPIFTANSGTANFQNSIFTSANLTLGFSATARSSSKVKEVLLNFSLM